MVLRGRRDSRRTDRADCSGRGFANRRGEGAYRCDGPGRVARVHRYSEPVARGVSVAGRARDQQSDAGRHTEIMGEGWTDAPSNEKTQLAERDLGRSASDPFTGPHGFDAW